MMADTLAAALAAFQSEAPRVAKDKTAKVPTKAGGSYSYQYADLADIAAAAYPLLAKHGLSFACLPEMADRGMVLRGVLLHASGERLEGVLPLSGGTPQELGSSLTYMRRYLLGALTGIVTDVDDDGTLAQHAATKAVRPRQAPDHPSGWADVPPDAPPSAGWDDAPPPQRPAPTGQRAATDAQLGKLRGNASRQGIKADDDFHDWLRDQLNKPNLKSSHELTMREASDLIERSNP